MRKQLGSGKVSTRREGVWMQREGAGGAPASPDERKTREKRQMARAESAVSRALDWQEVRVAAIPEWVFPSYPTAIGQDRTANTRIEFSGSAFLEWHSTVAHRAKAA